MTELLRYLADHLAFLYAAGRFRLVDSGASTSFGGDAYLTLEADAMRLRLIRDRGQLFMDFQGSQERGEHAWHSIDVVWRLLIDEQPSSAELSPDYVRFLEAHLDEIERRFSAEEAPATVAALEGLERRRAKELFG